MIKQIILTILCFISVNSFGKEFLLHTDYNCPYFCNEKKMQKKGYILEVLNLFFDKKGIKLKVKYLPYQRIIPELNISNKNISVLPLIDINNHSKLKTFKTSIGINFSAIALKSTDQFSYIGIEDLKGKTIALKPGGLEAQQVTNKLKLLNSGINRTISITGSDSSQRMLKMLSLGRADIAVSDYNSLRFIVGTHKIDNVIIKPVAITRFTPMFITFQKMPIQFKKLDKDFTQFIKDLRASGQLQKILDKYNIEDWKKFVVR
jgi:ABC-type amino acid transport substrate-binding protein